MRLAEKTWIYRPTLLFISNVVLAGQSGKKDRKERNWHFLGAHDGNPFNPQSKAVRWVFYPHTICGEPEAQRSK